MQLNDKALSSQDAVDSFDRLRASRASFRFANESEAEEWEQDGRIDEVRPSTFDVGLFRER